VSPTVAELLKQQTESTAGTPNVNGISTPDVNSQSSQEVNDSSKIRTLRILMISQ
jgi:hypothetical protein